MTRQQAFKEANKRWGRRGLIRANESVSSPERRETASAKVQGLRQRKKEIDAEISERLAGLDWYQALTAERRAAVEAIRKTEGHAFYKKFSVGQNELGMFWVKGQGDTWEEAFADADRPTGPGAVSSEVNHEKS